jgi:hypothetical protein
VECAGPGPAAGSAPRVLLRSTARNGYRARGLGGGFLPRAQCKHGSTCQPRSGYEALHPLCRKGVGWPRSRTGCHRKRRRSGPSLFKDL